MTIDTVTDKKIQEIQREIKRLEELLSVEIAKKDAGLRFGMEYGEKVFDEEVLRRYKEMKTSGWKGFIETKWSIVLTSPVIYAIIIPTVILDLSVTIYQHICFRAYDIPLVKRSDYMDFQRTHLPYLNLMKMINCAYCSYSNGVIAYAREIFSLTEKFWCPIKHAKKRIQGYHHRYDCFADYGDLDGFLKQYMTPEKNNS